MAPLLLPRAAGVRVLRLIRRPPILRAKKTPSLITASKIASALRIPLSELFESAPEAEPEPEYRLERQIYSLFHERSASQVAELMEILKKLRDPARVSALRRIIGK